MTTTRSLASPRLDGVRVLVVDDVPTVLTTVRDLLQWNGATVTAVGSAEDALDALQRERPCVLLSDLSMPGKGGYWLIGQVRALPAERGGATPAAALTAYAGEPHRTSVLRAGFQCHVEKPVRVEELVGVVGTLARMRDVISTETDAQAVRLPVVGQRDTRTVEKDTIELH
jgi:CheY-like chemotaxis protein